MTTPGPLAQFAGRIAYEFAQVQHLIPTYLHIILAALFPIYTAAHASLSRPASAAKPVTASAKEKGDSASEDEDDDEEAKPRMEGLSAMDAVLFPVMAGVALTSLYFLLKWDKDLLNKIMNWYMSLAGLYGVIKFLSDAKNVIHAVCFPEYYTTGGEVWHVNQSVHKVCRLSDRREKLSPLPGIWSAVPLPQGVRSLLWTLRGLPTQKLVFNLRIHGATAWNGHINVYNCSSIVEGLLVVAYFVLVGKPWYLTNLMGFAFSYTALQLISPTTFAIGSLVLVGLFFYDIYMVFFTPMMVTVAKNLDIPIKLLFPRPADPSDSSTKQQYSMLGLGDIVLPGIVMGLALRFDLYLFYLRKQRHLPAADSTAKEMTSTKAEVLKAPYVSPVRHWASHLWTHSVLTRARSTEAVIPTTGQFPKTYFHASLVGYVIGMCATLSAMHWSSHPQPALLYLVPGVLLSLWGTALARGELSDMWSFTEEESEEDASPEKAAEAKEPDAQTTIAENGTQSQQTKIVSTKSAFKEADALLSFTIRRHQPSKRQTGAKNVNWIAADKLAQNGQPPGKRLRTS